MTALASLREAYKRDKAALLQNLADCKANTRSLPSTLHKLALLVDTVLVELWHQADLDADVCLVAVGGFGRGELFPHSDVDVLVLLPEDQSPEHSPALQAQLERFIGSCWDVGLEIGAQSCLLPLHMA